MAAAPAAKAPSNKFRSTVQNATGCRRGHVQPFVARLERRCPQEHHLSLRPWQLCSSTRSCNDDGCACRKVWRSIAGRAYPAAVDRAWTSDYIRLTDAPQYPLQDRATVEPA